MERSTFFFFFLLLKLCTRDSKGEINMHVVLIFPFGTSREVMMPVVLISLF